MFDAILNLVFPATCVVCGSPVTEWRCGALCSPCADGLQRPRGPFCPSCGNPQPGSPGPGAPHRRPDCPPCRSRRWTIDFARFALRFDDTLREAIHHFKYADRVSLARPFGRAMAACLASSPYTRAPVVVPVPLDRRRERQRGYNQAYLLARQLGLGIDRTLVRRRRTTSSQTGLTRSQRAGNVRGAFECRRRAAGTYLVVDDVLTTGATVNEIARALRRSGAARVEALTLTRVMEVNDTTV